MENAIDKQLQNPEFLAELEKAQNLEDAATICGNYGIPVTVQQLLDAQAAPEGELSEEILDGVAGGSKGFLRWIVEVFRHAPIGGPIHPRRYPRR